MDSGCTFPVTTTAVVEGIGAEVMPLTKNLDIIDALGRSLEIIGIVKMFINNRVLGGRKMVEAAVIQGERKEMMISIQLFKKWDILHDSFPFQTVSDYIVSKDNKQYQAYSTSYQLHSSLFEESRKLKAPSRVCIMLG